MLTEASSSTKWRPGPTTWALALGCPSSQFEQHLRAVCGLPFGDTHLFRPIVMLNLLGDLWKDGDPDWLPLLADPAATLHLYDKGEARPARKMGHFTVTGESPEAALDAAEAHFKQLTDELG